MVNLLSGVWNVPCLLHDCCFCFDWRTVCLYGWLHDCCCCCCCCITMTWTSWFTVAAEPKLQINNCQEVSLTISHTSGCVLYTVADGHYYIWWHFSAHKAEICRHHLDFWQGQVCASTRPVGVIDVRAMFMNMSVHSPSQTASGWSRAGLESCLLFVLRMQIKLSRVDPTAERCMQCVHWHSRYWKCTVTAVAPSSGRCWSRIDWLILDNEGEVDRFFVLKGQLTSEELSGQNTKHQVTRTTQSITSRVKD